MSTIIKAFISRFSLDMLSRSVTLIINILIARYLTINDYGLFSYIITFVNAMYILTEVGTNTYALREIGKNPSLLGYIWENTIALKIILSILTILLIVILYPIIISDSNSLLLLLMATLWMISNSFCDFYQQLSNALHNFKIASKFIIASRGVFIIMITSALLLAYNRINLKLILFLYCLSGIISVFLVTMIFIRSFSFELTFPPREEIIGLLKSALPLGLAGFLTSIYIRLDILMLKWLTNDTIATGLYAASYRFYEIFYVMGVSLNVILLPLLSRNLKNKFKFNQYLNKSLLLTGFLSLIWILITWDKSSTIIQVVYGVKYALSSNILKILSITSLFTFWSQISITSLVALHKQKEFILTQTINIIITISLGLLLIPKWSYIGAALTITIAQFFNWLINYFILKKSLHELCV